MGDKLPQIVLKPISELKRAAEQKEIYEKKLVDKRFLYVYLNDKDTVMSKEVTFKRESYLHLVGLDYENRQSLKRTTNAPIGTNSLEFYNRLGNDTTLINDVSFIIGATQEDTNRYYRYTQHKIDNLSQLTVRSWIFIAKRTRKAWIGLQEIFKKKC